MFVRSFGRRQRPDPLFPDYGQGESGPFKDGHHTTSGTYSSCGVVFVANHVQQIRDQTSPSQWRHVETKCNPADDASRGITAKDLVENSRWISGPEFLWMPEDQWPQPLEDQDLVSLSDNPEVKKVTSYATSTQEPWNL